MQTYFRSTCFSRNFVHLVFGLSLLGYHAIASGLLRGQETLTSASVFPELLSVLPETGLHAQPKRPAETTNIPEPKADAEFLCIQRTFYGLNSEQFLFKQDRLFGEEKLSIVQRVLSDHRNYYSSESLTMLGAGVVIGGAMANSSIDNEIYRRFQSSVRSANSDEWFENLHASKELGNGKFTMPVFAGSWLMGKLLPDSPIAEKTGRWGERSLRGILVGAPPLLVMQQLTGGSRPTETSEGPEWHPFQDNNGISGHAFMGSLPFITAAKMTESRSLKATYYAASSVVPLSRMNDSAHYPSQVALGWWMAFLAASAVDASDHPDSRWRLYPYSTGDGSGILAEFKY